MIWQPEFTDKTLSRKPGAVQSGIKSILEKGLDKQPVQDPKPDLLSTMEHENVRGSEYYH
ncbi:hypothetical protein CSR89_004668 [Escherichia coli]|nr:hypothetical protein [Escherichia coli]EGZ3479014.1 hypothetical protein [Escherichia coli]EGZ3484447.1 hypothetical protein [Escherichia coli]EGZ3567578.1 hypothetical protein [Escherichia coli]EGZ4436995.1 hypothetical protein [Escherichia coli]